MKKTDITREVLEMHTENLLLKAIDEVSAELKNGVPAELQSEIDRLISKSNSSEIPSSNNVVDFASKRPQKQLHTFGETELLAASGLSLADWFSQPMNFVGAGFILDIRKVLGTEHEVDVYLTSNNNNAEKMTDSLGSYLGKSVHIIVSNNENELLDAVLYIDETGTAAEGSGKLIEQPESVNVKGEISISIVINMKGSE
jgi:hypothetical protein